MTIDDAGFTGQMSKFEITNAQFAKYLNDALAADEIVSGRPECPGQNRPL